MNANDLALLLQMCREKYTPEQIVTEIERVTNQQIADAGQEQP